MARSVSNNFYNTQQWKRVREQYKKSVGGLCEICWANGLVVPGEFVHHKIHLNDDNVNDPNVSLAFSNLQLVCRDCHAMLHKDNKTNGRYRILDDGTLIII